MLRTTTNEVKYAIRQYIIDCIDGEYLTECGHIHDKSPKTLVTAIYDCMRNEFWQGYEKHRTPNRYEALKQYLMGLPSSISVDFTYYDQRQLLKKWLQQTDSESDKYSDDKMTELFYHLITREFYHMLDA